MMDPPASIPPLKIEHEVEAESKGCGGGGGCGGGNKDEKYKVTFILAGKTISEQEVPKDGAAVDPMNGNMVWDTYDWMKVNSTLEVHGIVDEALDATQNMVNGVEVATTV